MQTVDAADIGTVAADAVLAALPVDNPRLGVATGETPRPLYAELARRCDCDEADLTATTLVALDEYVGIGPSDPRSYGYYVRTLIAEPLCAAGVILPDGGAADPGREAVRFEEAIVSAGGVDVQIAGIGANGHLAFNEPGSAFDSTSRVVSLTEQTRRDNARFFDRPEDVPASAITQGLGTISRARSVVLLARGSRKAGALAAMLHGPVSAAVPASILRTHPAVTVIADKAAAAQL
ncbi:glucosamine-6-phosphate deaminase [Mycolicibacterium moriokaense]|nr:glucosamine-6-phosphate deaminase [Mycolicibacterium moriokaense]